MATEDQRGRSHFRLHAFLRGFNHLNDGPLGLAEVHIFDDEERIAFVNLA